MTEEKALIQYNATELNDEEISKLVNTRDEEVLEIRDEETVIPGEKLEVKTDEELAILEKELIELGELKIEKGEE